MKNNLKSFRSRILNILFWSVISAAFIGPGTVTTASKAGADHGFDLLWALLFSTFACLVLQEASSRITIVSGMNLGEAIRHSLPGKKGSPAVALLIGGSVLIGIAAYQTGNILGAVSGIALLADIPSKIFILLIGMLAGLLLYVSRLRIIARLLGAMVAVMGVLFLLAAILIHPSPAALVKGLLVPGFPPGGNAGLLILGLVGTTVVPYNLFLGSGLSDKGGSLREMRIGLSVAIIFGGIISMAVLITGSVLDRFNSFGQLASALTSILGNTGNFILGFGLFAAGFTSAVTAPLAAAITVRSLWGRDQGKWEPSSLRFKSIWLLTLCTGIALGLTGINPVPAIILAQALNGLILPIISVYLLLLLNNTRVMGFSGLNSWMSNTIMGLIVAVTLLIGLTNIVLAVTGALKMVIYSWDIILIINTFISLSAILFLLARIYYLRRAGGK